MAAVIHRSRRDASDLLKDWNMAGIAEQHHGTCSRRSPQTLIMAAPQAQAQQHEQAVNVHVAQRHHMGGQQGRPIMLHANMYPIKLDGKGQGTVRQYTVTIFPARPPPPGGTPRRGGPKSSSEAIKLVHALLCQRILNVGLQNTVRTGQHSLPQAPIQSIAYDGRKAAYSTKTLPLEDFAMAVELVHSSDKDNV
ncbi:hypothetical protein K437DRAFT_265908 [Tilletiaria anomala UBC 951]|uniref:Uncharacterized protein n=1 Tax=Tilletiaria anomala (strain ATCC 24038 / CBS 436.72 / UBC 951) TaxID=1037660 RepID=A0A066WRF9_TILAU|nr:uncharacterized protein K437DRAFT_265908 [Tilletiaria anomala UBC 951]KDN53250.1 hypothetical protein K437DRAFT_265908 [Tilletiaria anomala UBC 951]